MIEVEEWFNQYFWASYPSDLTHQKKGPKSVALKAIIKLNPDENMRQEIMSKLEVLVRAARSEKRVGREPDRWCFASTWINQERWTMVESLESTHTELKKPVEIDHSERDKAYDKWLYNEAVSRGHPAIQQGESKQSYILRCREWGNKSGSLGRVAGGLRA